MMELRVKICGITKADQGRAIAQLGATALGFICVPGTPRYIAAEQIRAIVDQLPSEGSKCDRVGVFLDATIAEIGQIVTMADLNCVQLHGSESIEFCDALRSSIPDVEIIKALRIKTADDLAQASRYETHIDTLLLDAYHPEQAGGTGETLDWSTLQDFRPNCAWLLAGGINPANVRDALTFVHPNGIDLSSGVEKAPGDKDLERVNQLFKALRG